MCSLQLEIRCKELWGTIAVSLGHSSIQCTCAILRAALGKTATKVKMRDVMCCISCALPRLLGFWDVGERRDNPQIIYLFTNPIKPMSHGAMFQQVQTHTTKSTVFFGFVAFLGKRHDFNTSTRKIFV